MKQFQLTILAITCLITTSFAQQKVNDKAVIKTPEATCELCRERIEKYVSRQYGILSVVVNIKNKTTTVAWITDRTNIEEVKTNIANAGFDADDVTAEETAYKKLPRECKKVGNAQVAADSLKH
ncbi:MAG: heavy metal-associated domain-containing protein [Ferruginibacter sp.]